MKIEFLRAMNDGTWDTHVENIPYKDVQMACHNCVNRHSAGNKCIFDGPDNCQEMSDAEAVKWAIKNLSLLPKHKNVVLWAVYAVLDEPISETSTWENCFKPSIARD